jgi:hypothetical protein
MPGLESSSDNDACVKMLKEENFEPVFMRRVPG